jgi:hypothetical protein
MASLSQCTPENFTVLIEIFVVKSTSDVTSQGVLGIYRYFEKYYG